MTKLQTVFFGSGPVALRNLELLRDDLLIEAIVTKPTTEEQMARSFSGVPIYTVESRKELDALLEEHHFVSAFGLLIDFGIIISEHAINSFPKGIVNSHFSLLPEWRGADPITFSILSGQQQTGVSLMLVSVGMDEGRLLAQAPYNIPPQATTDSLTESLIEVSASLIREILPAYMAGSIDPYPQEAGLMGHRIPTYSRKLTKEDGLIDWRKPAAVLEREIRAYQPWPRSYTTLGGKEVTVTGALIADVAGKPGTPVATKNKLFVCCGEQALEITRLKPAGKKEMTAAAFLAGYGRLLQS